MSGTKRRSPLDLMLSTPMNKATEHQKDVNRVEGFRVMALYVRFAPNTKSADAPPRHVVIPFALDMLPESATVNIDGVDVHVYEHVSKDRLALRINVARKGQGKGAPSLIVHNPEYLTENELCFIASFNKITAEPGDIVELGNVRLGCSEKYPTPSLQMDSARVIPTAELGMTAADCALAIYRKTTRFIPAIVPLAENKAIRRLFPIRDNSEDAPKTLFTRDILSSFPLPLLSKPGVDVNKGDVEGKEKGTLDIACKKLPMYEAFGIQGTTIKQVVLPSVPEFVSEAHKDKKGQPVPAEAQLYTEAYVVQGRDDESGERFHLMRTHGYSSNFVAAPTLYPLEFDALMRFHPGFPVSVVATVDLNQSLNNSRNYGNESMRPDEPDGDLDVKYNTVVFNTERALLEMAIPTTLAQVQERYGGNNVLNSVPFVQDDREDVYAARGNRQALRNAFTNAREDKVLALDAAGLPLGDDKTTLYFAFPLKDELKGMDEIEDVSALTPAEGAKLIRDNMKKITKDMSKATPAEKLHAPWLQGDGKKQYPTFLFFSMERAHAEKLLAGANKPLDLSLFYTAPKDPAVMATDAVHNVEEFRFNHYVRLAKEHSVANGYAHEDAMEADEQAQGTKRALEGADASEEPEHKKQRIMPNFDDEKTRSGFEHEDETDDAKKMPPPPSKYGNEDTEMADA